MIQRLLLTDFRSYTSLDLSFGSGITVIEGPNGKGKSNLLEAVHLVTQAQSFRTRDDRDMVRWDSEGFVVRVEGESRGLRHEQAIGFSLRGRRSIRVQGKECASASELLGWFPCVAMVPTDLELAKGAPEIRRRFLDVLVGSQSPMDLDLLRRWNRILAQRNRLLKDALDGPPPDVDLLAVLTHQLAECAGAVVCKRLSVVKTLALRSPSAYAITSRSAESLHLQYRCSVLEKILGKEVWTVADAIPPESMIAEAYELRMGELARAEMARGVTLPGPQRDDLELRLNGHSVRDFGSQGQSRSVVLSLRLAAAEVLQNLGTTPLLLLDDVFAELDGTRREALVELLPKGGQVLVAVPRSQDLPFQPDHLLRVPF